MGIHLTKEELHTILLNSLGEHVISHSSIHEIPFMVELAPPCAWRVKIYLYNCTNPPGARQAGEYKIQIILPGQKPKEQGHIETEDGVITLLMGFASVTDSRDDGIFVIWELRKHRDPAYSANVQVSLKTLLRAYSEPMFAMKKRGNGEWIVVSRPQQIYEAIQKRVDVDTSILLEESRNL